MKTETTNPKFQINDVVEADTLIDKLIVVGYWYDVRDSINDEGYRYRLAFMTKAGKADKRKGHRFFHEKRLTKI